jgi:hypothetical protein
MQDLKKIYTDMSTADPSTETKFEWGSTSPSDGDGCVYINVDVEMAAGDLCLFFDFDQKESFELFKEIYIDKINELIGRIKWEFDPLP